MLQNILDRDLVTEILHLEKTEPEKVILSLLGDGKMTPLGFGARCSAFQAREVRSVC